MPATSQKFRCSTAQELAEDLKTNSTLTTVDLGFNLIRDNGAQVLYAALKIKSTLSTLRLENNSFMDNSVPEEYAQARTILQFSHCRLLKNITFVHLSLFCLHLFILLYQYPKHFF